MITKSDLGAERIAAGNARSIASFADKSKEDVIARCRTRPPFGFQRHIGRHDLKKRQVDSCE